MDQDALLDVAVTGDADAFMTLVGGYDTPLRSLAFKITGDAHAMQDVMQEAYVKAYTQLPKFDRRSSFHTWLFRICHNAAIDHVRRSKREVVSDSIIVELHPATNMHDSGDQRLDLLRALEELPLIHRSVVLLVDEQGFTYAEAAEILSVSPGTVSSRLVHARRSLRASLGAYFVEGN